MSDLKTLQEQFDRLIERKQTIKILGTPVVIPEGWAAEFAKTNSGFTLNLMRITIREMTLAAEKRVEHQHYFYDDHGTLVAEQYLDTGWEASGPALGSGRTRIELPSDYRVRGSN